jgi:hypothetical protein
VVREVIYFNFTYKKKKKVFNKDFLTIFESNGCYQVVWRFNVVISFP